MVESFKSQAGYETLEPLDKFGKLLMEHLRDRAIGFYELLVAGHWQAPSLQELQLKLQTLTDDQQVLVRTSIISAIDTGIHDFLFKLQEQADFENSIRVLVDGVDVISASDGLHGEPYSEDGWIANYSKYEEVA